RYAVERRAHLRARCGRLLEEKRHSTRCAPVPHQPGPILPAVWRTVPRTAFAAEDHPVNSMEIERGGNIAERWLVADEADDRWNLDKFISSPKPLGFAD